MRDPIDSHAAMPPEGTATDPTHDPTPDAAGRSGADLTALRERVRRLEREPNAGGQSVAGIDLGCPALAEALPAEGLALGRVHEITGPARPEVRDAAPFGFTAALIVRLLKQAEGRVAAGPVISGPVISGPVIWCPRTANMLGGGLSARGLASFGLDPARLVLVDAVDDAERLWVMEEALATPGVAAVVAELDPVRASRARADGTVARRLQLAAEKSGVTGFLLRPRMAMAAGGSVSGIGGIETRWRVAACPSPLARFDERPVWSVALERARRARALPTEPWHLAWDAELGLLSEVAGETAGARAPARTGLVSQAAALGALASGVPTPATGRRAA